MKKKASKEQRESLMWVHRKVVKNPDTFPIEEFGRFRCYFLQEWYDDLAVEKQERIEELTKRVTDMGFDCYVREDDTMDVMYDTTHLCRIKL